MYVYRSTGTLTHARVTRSSHIYVPLGYDNKSLVFGVSKFYIYYIFVKQTVDVVGQHGGLLDCHDCCTVSRSPWTTLRPGVVQHGESHSAEHAGGETVSMAIATVLSRRSAWHVSLRILRWLKTKTIRIAVKLLGICMSRRPRTQLNACKFM